MSQITDLTGTKWEFNETITQLTPANTTYNLLFTSNGTEYQQIERQYDVAQWGTIHRLVYGTAQGAYIYTTNAWFDQAYRTISITGGTDATNADLIAWLQSNATQIIEPEENPKIYIGTQPLVSASVGNADVKSIWVGNVKVWERVPATYDITATVTNGTSSGDTTIQENGTATVTITADSGYELPSSITVSGATYAYDSTTGVITLSEPTGAVSISVVCESSEWGGTDLTGTKWEFNEEINYYGPIQYFNLLFDSDGKSFSSFTIDSDGIVYSRTGGDTDVYDIDDGWAKQAYRTIEITGGTQVTYSNLISFLQSNATLISW